MLKYRKNNFKNLFNSNRFERVYLETQKFIKPLPNSNHV